MSTTQTRVVLYARISEDTQGDAAGVDRQFADARELALARGWLVVAEYSDNDISALTGKHRPGYQKVLDLVRAGKVDHVVVWQTSRLLRNRAERAAAIDLFGRQGVGIIAVKGQDLDLSTAYGRGMAGLLGEFDTMESEVKSERVAAAAFDRARKGKPNGALGYGWTAIGRGRDAVYEVNEVEAAVVRGIVDALLAGVSLLGVTSDLNDREIGSPEWATWQSTAEEVRKKRTEKGRRPPIQTWGKTSVKKIALRPSNAAVRVHHRGRPTEQFFDGAWPALVSRTDWERLTALFGDPARQTNGTTRPGARKHLLSWGIGECGVCGSKLRVARRGSSTYGVKKLLYVCDAKTQCVGRDEAKVDELVRELACARLSRPDAFDWLLGDEDEAKRAGERAAELGRRLGEAADSFADGGITADQLTRITERLRPQIEDAEAARWRHAPQLDATALNALAGPKAREAWDAMDVAQRRAVLEALGVRVIIDRVKRRGPGFDPESIRIDWKGQG